MASLKASCSSAVTTRHTNACLRPTLPSRRAVVAHASQNAVSEVGKLVALGATISSAALLEPSTAHAAQELASLAASDNRAGIIATLFVPALGWVGFNMLAPALNQLDKMNSAKGKGGKRRGIAAAVGLGAAASLLLAEHADAATEIAQLAASDSRLSIIATLFLPALGWVGFNILSPATNQLEKMNKAKDLAARSVAAALGLGAASLLLAEHADAATEIAQLAASDNRIGIIATLFLPALGWVGFNILSPATNQLDKMSAAKDLAARSAIGAAGLGAASLLMAEHADAVSEIAQLAAGDNRIGVIATLFVPALGWVGFNMLQPALNQLEKMTDVKESASPSVARRGRK